MEKFSDLSNILSVDIYQLISRLMSIDEVQNELIRYNQEQLQQGIDALGKIIKTIEAEDQNENLVYSLFTYGQKVKKGQDAQHVTLEDTGAFYDSMSVKSSENETEIIANFEKPDGNIMDNFDSSFDFLGLTPESLESFTTWVLLDYLYSELKKELEIG